MDCILTVAEQHQAGEAARTVGGYSELIRLEVERRRFKSTGLLVRNEIGLYSFQPTNALEYGSKR